MENVVGHEDVKLRFATTLARGRLASTYLFVGPEGVGKRTFAEALAAGLLCPRVDAATLLACGVCEGCKLSAAGNHPDLLRVARPDGKTTLPIELFLGPPERRHREGFCHDLALRPLVASRRVAILDDADDIGVESANALLKTLEEPPPRSVMILVGTSLARQLPTIRSRSQVVRFRPLDGGQVAEALRRPPLTLEPAEAARLAERAGGSVSRALERREGALDAASAALAQLLRTGDPDPLELGRLLDEETKAVGSEPRVRRRATRLLLGGAIEQLHASLLSELGDVRAIDRAVARLEACLDAEEAIERNGNQSAVAASWGGRVARP